MNKWITLCEMGKQKDLCKQVQDNSKGSARRNYTFLASLINAMLNTFIRLQLNNRSLLFTLV